MNTRHRKLYIILGSILGAFLIFLTVVFINTQQHKKKLLNEGTRTEAQVLKKYKQTTLKGKTKNWFVELALFADTSQVVKNLNSDKKTPTNINDKIDAIFDDINTSRVTGDYQTITLSISQHNYAKLKNGEWKTYVYFKDKPGDGMMLDELE